MCSVIKDEKLSHMVKPVRPHAFGFVHHFLQNCAVDVQASNVTCFNSCLHNRKFSRFFFQFIFTCWIKLPSNLKKMRFVKIEIKISSESNWHKLYTFEKL